MIPTAQCVRFRCTREPCERSGGVACARHWLALPRYQKDRIDAFRAGTLAASARQIILDMNKDWDAAGV